MSDPKSDGGSAMHDLCGLDADGIFSDAVSFVEPCGFQVDLRVRTPAASLAPPYTSGLIVSFGAIDNSARGRQTGNPDLFPHRDVTLEDFS